MKWRVIIRPRAEADLLRAIRDWYEKKRAGLGGEWIEAFRSAIRTLEQRPESIREYYRGFHRLLMHRFPYKIFYRMESDSVFIFRILHVARDHGPELKG